MEDICIVITKKAFAHDAVLVVNTLNILIPRAYLGQEPGSALTNMLFAANALGVEKKAYDVCRREIDPFAKNVNKEG